MAMSPPESAGTLSFELLAEIAVGATARIELCRIAGGARAGDFVAVKRLHHYVAEDPQFLDMFRDEVWMTAALKHTHVVEVLGWGSDADGPYLAVEFVRGVSLSRLMKTVFETGEMFTERMVVFLGACICDGLAAAHGLRSAQGELLHLVHRDLTPGNVLLGFDGELKITDFGLAKAKQRLTRTLTGLLKGQPQYMSPEQIRAEPLDGRSDLFALGVLLFELFGGTRPWGVTSELDVMRAITERPPLDLHKLRPKMDRALVEVVHRCLAKHPAERFQSAEELRDRLRQWLLAHGYRDDNQQSLARFVRRNAMRQMRWFERALAGEFIEQARSERALERSRMEPAQPRDRAGDDESSTEAPEPPESDWGEDGPTLIKKSTRARAMIEAARVRAQAAKDSGRGGRAKQAAPSDRGSRRGGQRSGEEDQATVPMGRAAVDRALTRMGLAHARGGGVEPIGGPAARPTRPGVVAPPDPDVPPLPHSEAAGGALLEGTGAPSAAMRAEATTAREGRAVPGDDTTHPTSPTAAATPSTLARESMRPAAPASVRPPLPPGAAPGSVRPPPRPHQSRRPAPHTPQPPRGPEPPMGASGGQVQPIQQAPPGAELSGVHAASVRDRAADIVARAGALVTDAHTKADAARRAADLAQSASDVVGIACEAVLLSSAGNHLAALERLRQAESMVDLLREGELAPRRVATPSNSLLGPVDRTRAFLQALPTGRFGGVLLVGALLLGVLALAVALLR